MLFFISIGVWILLGLIFVIQLGRSIRLVPTRKAHIVERLGKYKETLGPGFHLLLPFFDKVAFVQDLREVAIDVPPQVCFTRDNVQVEVDGVLYISITNAESASYGITDYKWGAIQLAQTTTRSVIGTLELDRTFEERDAVSSRVVSVLNEVSESWGIKVHRYEVKNIVVPNSVRDSMEAQMGAERERRALIARSEGDKQSRINASEGQKMEFINKSEGEMQRCVNEAEGRASEILAIARATAESIEKLGAAMIEPGGEDAVRLRLAEAYLGKLEFLARPDKSVLLPADLSRIDDLLAAVGLELPDGKSVASAVAAPAVAMPAVAMPAAPRRAAPPRAKAPAQPAHPAAAPRAPAPQPVATQPQKAAAPSEPAVTEPELPAVDPSKPGN